MPSAKYLALRGTTLWRYHDRVACVSYRSRAPRCQSTGNVDVHGNCDNGVGYCNSMCGIAIYLWRLQGLKRDFLPHPLLDTELVISMLITCDITVIICDLKYLCCVCSAKEHHQHVDYTLIQWSDYNIAIRYSWLAVLDYVWSCYTQVFSVLNHSVNWVMLGCYSILLVFEDNGNSTSEVITLADNPRLQVTPLRPQKKHTCSATSLRLLWTWISLYKNTVNEIPILQYFEYWID